MTETRRRASRSSPDLLASLKPLAPREAGSGLPLWSQLKTAIQTMIVTEQLGENARLPSESELCDLFGVSRTVVREALNQLVYERVIYKLQGKGAFVAGKRDDQGFLGSNIGFSGELHHTDHAISRTILRQELSKPTERAREMLNLASPDEPVVALDRVLAVDGVPRILVLTYVVSRLAPGFEQVPMHNRSLYETLARRYGITMRRAERWLEAASATAEQAKLLGIPKGAPVIAIESISYMQTDEPIEYYTAVYRTDHARLHFIVS